MVLQKHLFTIVKTMILYQKYGIFIYYGELWPYHQFKRNNYGTVTTTIIQYTVNFDLLW